VVKALVVAGEDGVASRVNMALRIRWPNLELRVAHTATRARSALADSTPDVMFVSSTLPDIDALALVQETRQVSDTVIFVLGSGDKDADIIEALEAGADDYASVPLSESLLVARLSASLRRAGKIATEEGPAVKWGHLAIDPRSHEARLKDRPLYLTPTEFKLLYHLAQHRGRVVTPRALEQVIWGGADKLYIDVLRKHIQRLRQKLGSARRGRMTITTVPRVGYKLAPKSTARSSR